MVTTDLLRPAEAAFGRPLVGVPTGEEEEEDIAADSAAGRRRAEEQRGRGNPRRRRLVSWQRPTAGGGVASALNGTVLQPRATATRRVYQR